VAVTEETEAVARWVYPPHEIFSAVVNLAAREDRDPEARVFPAFKVSCLTAALRRACKAAGVPHFSTHDLRHRRVSLMHADGISWADIGQAVGHDARTAADTYTHVLPDRVEVEYVELLMAA
jgi:integrase